jgi:hypothetical protein
MNSLRSAIQAACGNTLAQPESAIWLAPDGGGLVVNLAKARLADLDVLRGYPIVEVWLSGSEVTNLSAVRDLPLKRAFLGSQNGKVTDVHPLAECPDIEMVELCPPAKDVEPLRKLIKLKYISYRWDDQNKRPAQTAEEFWNEHSQAQQRSKGTIAATKETPFINGLGMKFVPVSITGGPTDGQEVLFSVWETRVGDYEAFHQETKRAGKSPEGKAGEAVGNVTWDEAVAFCEWLTDRERRSGGILAGVSYRLPTDHEWSCAVGIGGRETAAQSPEVKSGKISDIYPWGRAWPPPQGAGNYADAAAKKAHPEWDVIPDYDDGFASIAPAGVFDPNSLGIHDLGGNVWEWCSDLFESSQSGRVIRGGSYYFDPLHFHLSSFRLAREPKDRRHNHGFRVVLAPVAASKPGG